MRIFFESVTTAPSINMLMSQTAASYDKPHSGGEEVAGSSPVRQGGDKCPKKHLQAPKAQNSVP
jgi:hypothetical protein